MNTRKEGFLHRDRQNNDFTLSAVGRKDTSRESKQNRKKVEPILLFYG